MTKAQKQRLIAFAQSSYNVANRMVAKSLITVANQSHEIDRVKLGQKILGHNYKDQDLRKHVYLISQSLDLFFKIESIRNNFFLGQRALVISAEKNDFNSIKNKILRECTSNALKPQTSEDAFYIFQNMNWAIKGSSDIEDLRSYQNKEDIKEKSDTLHRLLDNCFITEKIKLFFYENYITKEHGTDEFSHTIDEITHASESKNFNPDLITKAYYKLFIEYRTEHKTPDFNSLFRLIESTSKVSHKDGKELYRITFNLLIRWLNKGNNLFKEVFELNKIAIAHKLLFRNNLIEPTAFRNIVVAASQCKEFKWALNFIDTQNKFLPEKNRKTSYSFNRARILINMKKYDEVIDILRDVEYEDLQYNINSKLILINAYYELDEYQVLMSTIRAFKVFLRRRRNISVKRKKNFTDHCDVVYNLVKAGENRDPKRVQKAYDIMQSNPAIPSLWWLREKVTEMAGILKIEDPQKVLAKTD